jgi:hypothetical protein
MVYDTKRGRCVSHEHWLSLQFQNVVNVDIFLAACGSAKFSQVMLGLHRQQTLRCLLHFPV